MYISKNNIVMEYIRRTQLKNMVLVGQCLCERKVIINVQLSQLNMYIFKKSIVMEYIRRTQLKNMVLVGQCSK